ncbi:hypothetical protein E2C01_066685 [Portunus trituberculatus]|uniref:Uncharacterized protein n=1 Tax=Portunus trituberculatus TaxID=210409 RepID=A0A5B7HHT2_PORTR|nr:hypothetical protein [Portunus trituberculatus]
MQDTIRRGELMVGSPRPQLEGCKDPGTVTTIQTTMKTLTVRLSNPRGVTSFPSVCQTPVTYIDQDPSTSTTTDYKYS